jgi:hypothetical protein
MKKILLTITLSSLASCKVVPKDDGFQNIIPIDPAVGRASITCLQRPMNHQPIPAQLGKRDQRTIEVTDQNDCMESEMRKVALKNVDSKKNIKLDIVIKSDKSDDFDLEKLEKLIKKKGQDEE